MRAIASLALLALVLAGCSSPDGGSTTSRATTGAATTTATTTAAPTTSATTDAHGEAPHVEVYDNRFDPTGLEVEAGTTVAFHNEGQRAHTVTVHKAGDPATTLLHDAVLQPGQGTEYTFAADGATYHVWCKYHGTMTSGMAMTVTTG